MSSPIPALESYLVAENFLSRDQLEDFRSQAGAEGWRALAEFCCRQRGLTLYQRELIIKGKADELFFDEHIVVQMLGRGSQAVVFEAIHGDLGRRHALKVLDRELLEAIRADMGISEWDRVVRRFRQGAQAAAHLWHENIVQTYDSRKHDSTFYLVTEFVEGRNLQQVAELIHGIAVEDAMEYVIQAARGLSYAHHQGVVHRDVKPANLLLEENRRIVKIVDFGVARITKSEGTRITLNNETFGTPGFISPEQANDLTAADCRSDIYSLGCTLYTLLTGRLMYDYRTVVLMLLAHERDPIPPLCANHGELPRGLSDVFEQMVAKDPADRFQSMDEVIDALSSCVCAGREQRQQATA